MSIHELEARLEKLSADIAWHRKILNNLQQNKSLLQRQINAVRDPVARLPLEISSEIFLRCLPTFPEPGAHHVPMLFLGICNAWTDIALSTPSLWAAIHVVFPRARGFTELLVTWLQRAGTRPLSVSLSNIFDDSEGVVPLIWRYGQQLKHLELCYDEEEDIYEYRLSDLWSAPLPLLETLTIRCSSHLDNDLGFRSPRILELLHLAPNLVECMFDYMLTVYGFGAIKEPLALPNLRRLAFGSGQDNESDDRILTCLTIPHLESLTVSMLVLSVDDLLSFLKRSSPPLRELILGTGLDSKNQFDGLEECLRLVPTLTRLEFWYWPVTRNPEELFAASPSEFLPNLRSLAIRVYLAAPYIGIWWETLLRVLTARRTQIQIIHIECESFEFLSSSQIVANIPAGFRELVAGGMKLYIGPDTQNLVSL
ncbi:hypothetical protein B0H11DRAFT_2369103 [Mycena galericulata]|nr:hypothetical protein B0H11DRAFT_2369103 [Mycena galericulata]